MSGTDDPDVDGFAKHSLRLVPPALEGGDPPEHDDEVLPQRLHLVLLGVEHGPL